MDCFNLLTENTGQNAKCTYTHQFYLQWVRQNIRTDLLILNAEKLSPNNIMLNREANPEPPVARPVPSPVHHLTLWAHSD